MLKHSTLPAITAPDGRLLYPLTIGLHINTGERGHDTWFYRMVLVQENPTQEELLTLFPHSICIEVPVRGEESAALPEYKQELFKPNISMTFNHSRWFYNSARHIMFVEMSDFGRRGLRNHIGCEWIAISEEQYFHGISATRLKPENED